MSLLKISFFLFTAILLGTNTIAGEKNTYKFSWLDEDKEIFVLQNRKFRKKGRVHIMGGIGKTTSGAFVDSMNFQLRAGYFFKEEWGFELVYSKNNGDENDAAASVRSTDRTPYRRIVQSYLGGMIVWAPFYGKLNTFNTVLYYDWFIGLGLATLDEENNREDLQQNNSSITTITPETHTGVMWTTAVKFWLSQSWSTRVDLTAVHFRAQTALAGSTVDNKTNFSNFDATIGLEYNF